MLYKYGIEKNTYFETEVISATFDELTNLWSVTSQNKNNKIQEKTNIIISCVGQLNQPNVPNINGIDDFQGDVFHSSQWPDYDVISLKKSCSSRKWSKRFSDSSEYC